MAKKELTTFARQTLMKQFKEYQKKPHDQISIGLHGDDISVWEVCYFNIDHGPLAEGFYRALLKFPYDFPNNPPEMVFQTEMWHPNIYKDGKVCISILHPPGTDEFNQQESADERWRPIIGVEAILISVFSMLLDEHPNLDSPANIDASVQFKENHAEYIKKVKRLARQSAETAFE